VIKAESNTEIGDKNKQLIRKVNRERERERERDRERRENIIDEAHYESRLIAQLPTYILHPKL
jgi:hypothetical protein